MPVSTPSGYLDFTNATPRATKVIATSNVGIGTSDPIYSLDVMGTANVGALTATSVDIAGGLSLDLPVATIASNLVTYDTTTGELFDSGGLFSNKLSVVSEQPPSALSGASTTVEKHGIYKVTASTGTPQNAFDKVTSTTWTASSSYTGGGGTGVYVGSTNLATGLEQGDWVAVELPYKATLRHLTLTAGDGLSTSLPEKANLYATNDTVTWTELKNWQAGETTVLVNATEPYKKYAIVTTKTAGNATLQIGQLKLFCESFSVDGGKIEMATSALTGGASVMEQTTAHAREPAVLKKYPEVVFADGKFEYNDTTSTYTQGGYTVTASTTYDAHYAIKAFNGVPNDFFHWQNSSFGNSDGSYSAGTQSFEGTSGEWLKLQLPKKIRPTSTSLYRRDFDGQSPKDFKIYASVSGSSWTLLTEQTGVDNWTNAAKSYAFDTDIYYKYFAILVTKITRTNSAGAQTSGTLGEWELYGTEETATEGDTSLDTTIVSKYNTPDLTSASLYLDGLKGSTATDYSGRGIAVTENNVTWDSTEKSWTLSGAATSNVVSADLGLEGDQPHSISAWVKADQLGYGTPLFHVGTAEGEGDAASRVGFVDDSHISFGGEDHYFSNAEWHNVTYTYNGEGSDKKLYLDGRLVGTAANEDTFGDYPPFNMSTYSQYGYTVSASTDAYDTATTPFYAWKAFNNTVGNEGWHAGEYQNGTDWYLTYVGNVAGAVYDTANYSRSIGGIDGEWLKLEMPHKLCVDYITLKSRTNANDQAPKDFKILGSNDDVNWDVLSSHTGVTASETGTTHNVGASKSYKYLTIVVTRVQRSTGSDAHLVIGELSYHGHRENDLVRFPDPTNVLKYPHVAMTGPAQRGYVVTQSSYSTYNVNYGYGWKAFDSTRSSASSEFSWQTDSSTYPSSGNARTGVAAETITESSNTHVGSWVTLETPRKIRMSSVELTCPQSIDQYAPNSVVILGSDNNSTWNFIKADSYSVLSTDTRTITLNSATAYKYHMLLVKTIGSATAGYATTAFLSDISYYGTEPEDVVARIGDGYDGKVRNLRVFSTALSQDRVQEIFDADKDEFALAKSSVSVYRGHLGIGTTEPKAALTVMDEVGELEEFPPRAMTAAETYMEGHGVFRVSDTGSYNNSYPAWFLFNHTIAGAKSWYSLNGTYYNGTDNSYSGTAQMTPSSPLGDYIKLELPYRVKAKAFLMYGPNYENEYPRDYTFYGSNDGELWTNILSVTGAIVGTSSGVSGSGTGDHNKHEVDSSTFFKYFAIIITKGSTARNTYVGIDEWRILGTREQGASTLHNGELTLTRNLTVPRIGPALDADDTPRRDRLVVEYNTSTNPTENGVVKDTSGRGLNGLMYNDASYDATEKALVFDGTDDYIKVDDTGIRGDYIHSVSFWIYNDNYNINPFWIGENLDGKRINVYITASQIDYSFRGDTVTTTLVPPINRWWHLTLTYNGTQGINGRKIYIDGVEQTTTHSGTAAALNIVDGVMYLGTNFQQAADLNGKMSNFKLYDVAITADEVKRLYDMGRCDEGHHVVNFSKTRVGIGLGDGEAPRGALEVRGPMIGGCPVFFQRTAGSSTASNTTFDFNDSAVSKGGGWGSDTSKFYAPIAGYYHIAFSVMSLYTDGVVHAFRFRKNGTDYPSNNQDARVYSYLQSGSNNIYMRLSGQTIMYLAVGDYMDILNEPNTADMHPSYNQLTGFYLSN